MDPTFLIAGRLTRDYLLPPVGLPMLDAPGGSLLYAAGGLAVWEKETGLIGRVGEDYPREWLRNLEERGLDVHGIKILPQSMDLRAFVAYTAMHERSHSNPVSHFARRALTFPKALLGYQSTEAAYEDPRQLNPDLPAVTDIPKNYHKARAVHLCPLDFVNQSQLILALKGGSIATLSLDPSPHYMKPTFWKDLRVVLQGVTIFHPSEEELRGLFWGETNDLWEMAKTICEYGCEIIVIKRGAQGQMVYDSKSKRRWEIPAYPSRMADPTGAGDAFCGGYLAGFLKTNDALEAALYGSVSASLKVEGNGPFYALDVLPGLAEARLSALRELAREMP
jgi:sugar/nucleoside kinase (ribokinase family)